MHDVRVGEVARDEVREVDVLDDGVVVAARRALRAPHGPLARDARALAQGAGVADTGAPSSTAFSTRLAARSRTANGRLASSAISASASRQWSTRRAPAP